MTPPGRSAVGRRAPRLGTVTTDHVSATRSELLARKARIRLAGQGRDLLKDKRAALMREFAGLQAEVLAELRRLEEGASVARRALAEAVAFNGPGAVGAAALAAGPPLRATASSRSVAGVPVVALEHGTARRPRTGRGYALAATSARIDEVTEAFEDQLDRLLSLAAAELNLRRLAAEIAATTRRVNALEHAVIPTLETERDRIALVLDERELEDRVRLRRARSARAA
jgi:V/A-type H+/Na+-transporting ATPase subunit D